MTSRLTINTRGQSFELEQGRPSTPGVKSFELTMSTQKYHVHGFLEHNANIKFSLTKTLQEYIYKSIDKIKFINIRLQTAYLLHHGEYAEGIQAPTENARKEFKHRWRICQIMVICGTKNRLRMRRKYLNGFGECAERIYAYMEKTQKGSWRIRYKSVNISVNNNKNSKYFQIHTYYTIWDGLSEKTISRYCPFKGEK